MDEGRRVAPFTPERMADEPEDRGGRLERLHAAVYAAMQFSSIIMSQKNAYSIGMDEDRLAWRTDADAQASA